jgi:hypothetical protein
MSGGGSTLDKESFSTREFYCSLCPFLLAHVGFQDDPAGGQDGFGGPAKPRQLPREDKCAKGAKAAADRNHQRSADLVGGPAH